MTPRAIQIRKRGAGTGLALFALAIVVLGGALFSLPQAATRAWYVGAFLLLHLGLGCASLLFIGDLAGARWTEQLEPLLRRGKDLIFWSLPLVGVAFFRLPWLFPWTDNPGPSGELFPLAKEEFLSPAFFLIRMAVYALLFALVAHAASAAGRNLRARRRGETRPASSWSAGGIVLYAFTNLLFQVDAVMSIDPHWFSTGFPVIMMSSQTLTAYCLCLFCHCASRPTDRKAEAYFGNLLLATLLFWLYVAFVQFLIIWMGNLTEDIGYFLQRSTRFWKGVSGFLFVFSFVIPFLILLRSDLKRDPRLLGWLALHLSACQILYIAWAILPSWESHDWISGGLFSIALLGFGGLALRTLLTAQSEEVSNG